MADFIIQPTVDAVREFLEIAGDFTNPLELVREAISNSIDAGSDHIEISFDAVREPTGDKIVITISDNGSGMDRDALQAFFDLGNSPKRGDFATIGEKGHGTKVYFNCERLSVQTVSGHTEYSAIMEHPYSTLHGGDLPQVQVTAATAAPDARGTKIKVFGFNGNKGELFTHERLVDYVNWFTKFGSCEKELGHKNYSHLILHIKGLNRTDAETIKFGHIFPEESAPIGRLFEEHLVRAPDFFCKKVIKTGHLEKHPHVNYEAVFYIEGNKVKQEYNKMLRRPGYAAPAGGYVVTDRYGIWLTKDYIPVERKNHWISQKGTEYTRFHAFFNCQRLSLTANRGPVANTPPDILADIENTVKRLYEEIIDSDDWRQLEWLESEADAFQTQQKETRDFEWRKGRATGANVCTLNNISLVQPTRESGVYALLIQLAALRPDALPFDIVEYDTHSGIDVIAKLRSVHDVNESALFYVELKLYLDRAMNHSFSNMRYIVCWDTNAKHGDHVRDLAGEERVMHVVPPDPSSGNYTGYFLKKNFRNDIEVIVLKDYLREKLGLEFRPRTMAQKP